MDVTRMAVWFTLVGVPLTLFGIVIGVIALLRANKSISVTERAARGASDFAGETRNALNVLARALNQAGKAEVTFDAEGRLKSLNFTLNAEPGEYRLNGGDATLTHRRNDGSEERR